jgi:hypothetical protein
VKALLVVYLTKEKDIYISIRRFATLVLSADSFQLPRCCRRDL